MEKMEPAKNKDRYLIFDESGNMGKRGRYFVVACIDTTAPKALHNIMHKKLGVAKKMFPELAALHSNEIKAKDAYPCIKYHLLECIASKDLRISYIVADIHHVKPHLLKEKNVLYNYLMRLLIEQMVTPADNGSIIHIICDNHSTKVPSANSFAEYIKLVLLYEKNLDIQLSIRFMDSDRSDAYIIQAADYIANALYGYYEYSDDIYYNRFKNIIDIALTFPWRVFAN